MVNIDTSNMEESDRQRRCWPNMKKQPLDGGWGWMVVLGCSLMHLLVAGFSRSYGVVYIQLQQRFHSSAAITAWVGGTCTALRMGLSPIATSLSSRFGARPVIFSGGLLIALGCVVSGFTPNTEFMFFSYAILTGVGGTLAYAPSLVLVGQYFDKYRAIAVGLGSAGSGIGVFGIPPSMNAMFDYYGYTGSFLIMGAVMLNVCICGALHRPLEANIPPKIKETKETDHEARKEMLQSQDLDKNGVTDSLRKETNGVKEFNSYDKLNMENTKVDEKENHIELNGSEFNKDVNYLQREEKEIEAVSVEFENTKSNQSKMDKTGCSVNLKKYIDLTLCKDPVFLVYIFAMGFHTLSYMAGQMLVPAVGQARDHSQASSVFLLSILGIADTIGRSTSGFIFDVPVLKRYRSSMYNFCILIAGVCHLMWAFCEPYAALAFGSALHGLFNGCVVGQRAVILADLLGVEKLSSSFGITVFVQGCGIMVGPAIAGVIRDYTGDYTGSYIFTFCSAMLGAVLFFLSSHSQYWCFNHKKQ